NADAREDVGDEEASSPVSFHAHRLILKACAPMLASLFGSDDENENNEKIARVSITDINPTIFHHLLYYVYGGSVPDGEMKIHAKDIINAADKYSIVNLKLQAEAAYVKSTEITIGNAIDILLYADSLNCAFLKEAVMDFLAENSSDSQQLSFADVPSSLMKDVFAAFCRKMKGANEGNDDDLSVMSVNELRRQLAELGLDVDGSREAMIATLKANAEFAVDSNEDGESGEDSESDSEADED
ncbi:hypothetical protein ACHAWT_006202, partial [Skeletonema menzelii]